jgi:hypothetical protein
MKAKEGRRAVETNEDGTDTSDDDNNQEQRPDSPPLPLMPGSPPGSPYSSPPRLDPPPPPRIPHDPRLLVPNIVGDSDDDDAGQKVSASERKVLQPSPRKTIASYDDNTNIMVSVSNLKSLLQNKLNPCDECGGETVLDVQNKHLGLAVGLRLVCYQCKRVSGEKLSSRRQGRKIELNERFASAITAIGLGSSAASTISMHMNMPGMHENSFNKNSRVTTERVKGVLEDCLKRARQRVRDFHRARDPTIGADDVIDIYVSFDGSWKKRGFKSNFSFAAVIEIKTGLVIDFVVLSKLCFQCSMAKHNYSGTDYDDWYQKHKADCDINFDPAMSSGSMEVESAKIMWLRSIELGNFRYIKMVSDGDAKTLSALHELDPYSGTVVSKEECINHVSKRLGTALRNLVAECIQKGNSISGRGDGTLTGNKIKAFTHYYGTELRRYVGTNVEKMKQGIMASLLHCTATDELASHKWCPDSTETCESWCFWKKAFAEGRDPTDKEKHKAMLGTRISKEVGEKMFPIYTRLTDPKLLSRCLLGADQNRNESLHNCVWGKLPKEKHHTLYRLLHAAGQAVMQFNEGCSPLQAQINALGYGEGQVTTHQRKMKDVKRLKHAIIKRDIKSINQVQVRKRARAEMDRRAGKMNPSYGPGIAGTSTDN